MNGEYLDIDGRRIVHLFDTSVELFLPGSLMSEGYRHSVTPGVEVERDHDYLLRLCSALVDQNLVGGIHGLNLAIVAPALKRGKP